MPGSSPFSGPQKRARGNEDAESSAAKSHRSAPRSLTEPVSPPKKRNRQPGGPSTELGEIMLAPISDPVAAPMHPSSQPKVVSSPYHLTAIRDLPAESNKDAITLKELLGDPLISECWEFNYLHDVDFLMKAFDEDVRHLVDVHIVHGFWKKEDPRRMACQRAASSHKNITLHAAFLPEMFGTHHTKMLVLFRHDDTAQVIIHTANMIPRDWTNMTQAVWKSPMLPRYAGAPPAVPEDPAVGSGEKFKMDLLAYLRAYDTRQVTCKALSDKLAGYDFSSVRAALIGSVPGRHSTRNDGSTKWGWASLKQALSSVPVRDGKSDIAVQVSSIATLGPTPSWLQNTLFSAMKSHKGKVSGPVPEFKVVFPTPDEIRRCLDGYSAGASIHTKIQSAQQQKQLQYLKPIFCHWANDAPKGAELPAQTEIQDAGRARAAPHIKTYIRYGEESIDWVLVTSANISKQAWGEAASSSGELRISSYEIGVLLWPSLLADGEAIMKPTFRRDMPSETEAEETKTVIGVRMPYSLPLQRYGKEEIPWVATASYDEPDWRGGVWSG